MNPRLPSALRASLLQRKAFLFADQAELNMPSDEEIKATGADAPDSMQYKVGCWAAAAAHPLLLCSLAVLQTSCRHRKATRLRLAPSLAQRSASLSAGLPHWRQLCVPR